MRMSCAVLEEVCGEGVAEGVAGGALGDARLPDRQLDRALEDRLVQVVAALPAGLALHVAAGGGEYPLPGPLAAGVGVLACQRAR